MRGGGSQTQGGGWRVKEEVQLVHRSKRKFSIEKPTSHTHIHRAYNPPIRMQHMRPKLILTSARMFCTHTVVNSKDTYSSK